MAFTSLFVNSTSPLVSYSNGGADWSTIGASDPRVFSDARITNATNAGFTMDFSGSQITAFGRSSGLFNVTLDGVSNTVQGSSQEGVLFTKGFDQAFHTFSLSTLSGGDQGSSVDLEFGGFLVGGYIGSSSSNATFDDFSDHYIEHNSEQVQAFGNTTDVSGGRNGTSTYSFGTGSGVALKFNGSQISVYSPPLEGNQPARGDYSVYINSSIPPTADDVPFDTITVENNSTTGRLSFFAFGLPGGEHTLVLTNTQNDGSAFAFDYAKYITPRVPAIFLKQCWSNCSDDPYRQSGPGYSEVEERAGGATPNGAVRNLNLRPEKTLAIVVAFVGVLASFTIL
ncbi:hypothetical protein I317_03087 [Kwoniella heveanensis CBS 569]|nr:hypothetical protein I317_03087 [Kwoniella heveanensis CBS 569]